MRIVLADPDAMFRDAFAHLLTRRGHTVVARSGTLLGLLQWIDDWRGGESIADVVVMEPEFPDVPGPVAVGKVRAASPRLPMAVVTGSTDGARLTLALEAGANSVAVKTDGIDEVEKMLHRLTTRPFEPQRSSSDPLMIWSSGARALAGSSRRRTAVQAPTARELQVIRHLVEGESTRRMGQLMGVSTATVRTHLQHLFIKFGVHSRLELIALAVRTGMVESPLRGPVEHRLDE